MAIAKLTGKVFVKTERSKEFAPDISDYQLEAIIYNQDYSEDRGIFDPVMGINTVNEIINELNECKTVIVDTSEFSGATEILIGSMIASEAFHKRRLSKSNCKPILSIVLEEAPRVLGKEVLEKGSNIFSTIAREGRKFGIGLTAITG